MVKALQFHRITSEFQFCGTWNRPAQFEGFLNFIQSNGIKVILPGEEDGVILSFDDGERCIYDYAFPILKKFGLRAIVFLVVGYIGRKNWWDISLTHRHTNHLAWDEILEMKKWGIEFGSHTMTHRNLTKLNRPEIEYELLESKRIIEKRIGGCRCLSYPFNRVDSTVIDLAFKAGYKFGFGGDGKNKFLIKKEAIYITDNIRSFGVKILETPALIYRYERVKQTVINYFTIATMLNKRS